MTRLTLKLLKEEIEALKKEIAMLKKFLPYQERWPKPEPKKCPCCGKNMKPYRPYVHYGECQRE
jgi:hypothetical protein